MGRAEEDAPLLSAVAGRRLPVLVVLVRIVVSTSHVPLLLGRSKRGAEQRVFLAGAGVYTHDCRLVGIDNNSLRAARRERYGHVRDFDHQRKTPVAAAAPLMVCSRGAR